MASRQSRTEIAAQHMADRAQYAHAESDDGTFMNEAFMYLLLRNYEAAINTSLKTATSIVIAAVIFLLIDHDAIVEVNLGIVKISDLKVLMIFLPAVIAYLFSNFVGMIQLFGTYRRVYTEFMKVRHPRMWQSGLHIYALAPSRITQMLHVAGISGDTRPGQWYQNLSTVIVFVLVCLSPLFFIYCFIRLFATYGLSDPWIWLSILLTLVFVVEAIFSLALEHAADKAIAKRMAES